MATNTIGVSAANYQYGVESDETGINIESFSVRYYPEFDDKLPNKDGQTIIRARPDKFSREISVSGEVNGSTGLMALTLAAAATVTNDVDTFDGVGAAGDIWLDEVTESQERNGFRKADFSLSSDPAMINS
jgi:hypothetical protein